MFMVSLRKILFTIFCTVAGLLTLVIVLGLLQYRFTHEYDTIIYQGEKILFRFDTLREHLTRSMLSGNVQNIQDATTKIDALNADLTRLLENPLVPGEYKLALINQVDIPRIAALDFAVKRCGTWMLSPSGLSADLSCRCDERCAREWIVWFVSQ